MSNGNTEVHITQASSHGPSAPGNPAPTLLTVSPSSLAITSATHSFIHYFDLRSMSPPASPRYRPGATLEVVAKVGFRVGAGAILLWHFFKCADGKNILV